MKKIFIDILKTNGKWSYKRITSFYILNVAILYSILPVFFPKFNVLESIFATFITYSATMVGLNVWQKIKIKKETEE